MLMVMVWKGGGGGLRGGRRCRCRCRCRRTPSRLLPLPPPPITTLTTTTTTTIIAAILHPLTLLLNTLLTLPLMLLREVAAIPLAHEWQLHKPRAPRLRILQRVHTDAMKGPTAQSLRQVVKCPEME